MYGNPLIFTPGEWFIEKIVNILISHIQFKHPNIFLSPFCFLNYYFLLLEMIRQVFSDASVFWLLCGMFIVHRSVVDGWSIVERKDSWQVQGLHLRHNSAWLMLPVATACGCHHRQLPVPHIGNQTFGQLIWFEISWKQLRLFKRSLKSSWSTIWDLFLLYNAVQQIQTWKPKYSTTWIEWVFKSYCRLFFLNITCMNLKRGQTLVPCED